MCECWSYNMQEGETPNKVLDPNKYFEWDSEASSVCVDACIADQITMLWENGIWTKGCCCGHGKMKPNVVLGISGDPRKAQVLLSENDSNRDWRVLQWQLVSSETDKMKSELTQGIL